MSKSIEQTVSEQLRGASELYLREIVAHGIHNLTNDYHGSNSQQYDYYANEFMRQASERLETN